MKPRILILTIILAAACCAPLAAQNYTFETNLDCGTPAGMNGSGVVVGSGAAGGTIYFEGKCQSYPTLQFLGVSDTNWLVAGLLGANTQPFYLIEPEGKVIHLPDYAGHEGNYTYCCIDTATGTLAGNYWPSVGATISGFFYQSGEFTSLPWSEATDSIYWYTITALNNTGTVVGNYNGNYFLGFVYAKGKMTLLGHPGATYTYFQGVNDNGVVVGYYNGPGTVGVFLYNLGTAKWTDLNFQSPYNGMTPVGISNTGVIALQASPSGGLVIATPTN